MEEDKDDNLGSGGVKTGFSRQTGAWQIVSLLGSECKEGFLANEPLVI